MVRMMMQFGHFFSLVIMTITCGMQAGIIHVAFSFWLKTSGVHIVYLGLLSLVVLPFSLKPLWMPFFDTFSARIAQFGHRKAWLFYLNLAAWLMVYGFSCFDPQVNSLVWMSFYAAFYTAVIATSQAMTIAYQMELLDPAIWAGNEGKITAAYYAGLWLAGPLFFYCTQFVSWNDMFRICSLILAFLWCCSFFIPDSAFKRKATGNIINDFFSPFKELFGRTRHILIPLLLFMMLYRVQDRVLMSMSGYFLLDSGITRAQMLLSKTVSTSALVLGGFIGSYMAKKLGYRKTLKLGVLFNATAASLFLLQSISAEHANLFYFAVLVEKITRGMFGTVFFTYQMIFCNKYYAMSQFSALLALDKLSGVLFSSISGFVVHRLGWSWFFVLAFCMTLPALYFMRKLPMSMEENEEVAKSWGK